MTGDRFHVDSLAGLRFFATPPRPCSYLPGRQSVSVFADPGARLSQPQYDSLATLGFRRSGGDLYRPACAGCNACVPVRVEVPYRRSRNQQRVWHRNRDLVCRDLPPAYRDEHYALYMRYQRHRHPGGGMDETTPEQYLDFLTCDWSRTRFLEFRAGGRLLGVAVTDYLADALSAVYTFFDPDQAARSLGTFSILYQLDLAQRLGLDWLYLGYWIADCRKMAYKVRFRPLQGLRDGRWSRLA